MILLDQDLDPHPPSASAARSAPSVRPVNSKLSRLPSTRSLARFLLPARKAVRLKGDVTVLLTTDRAIRRLNRQYRGIDKATDVLSFPAGDAEVTGVAGDLAISVPTALRQAAQQGHTLAIEIKVLILHGLLHLAGFDHETDDGQMARRERALRARLELPQGLIERSTSGAKALAKSARVKSGLKPGPTDLAEADVARKRSITSRTQTNADALRSKRGRKP
jgi:probable rRNA maturation factor